MKRTGGIWVRWSQSKKSKRAVGQSVTGAPLSVNVITASVWGINLMFTNQRQWCSSNEIINLMFWLTQGLLKISNRNSALFQLPFLNLAKIY